MAYRRKTRDYWDIQQYTGPEYGWESVNAEDTWTDAKRSLKEYRENQPEYAVRARRKREPIQTDEHADLISRDGWESESEMERRTR